MTDQSELTRLREQLAAMQKDADDSDLLLGVAWQRARDAVTGQGKPLDEADFNRQQVRELAATVRELREQLADREHKIVAQTADLNRGEIEREKLREQVDCHRERSSAFATSMLEQGRLVTRLQEQVAHQTKCIDAQSETCARYAAEIERLTKTLAISENQTAGFATDAQEYAAQLDEAVGLLRTLGIKYRWGQKTEIVDFLTAYDANAGKESAKCT